MASTKLIFLGLFVLMCSPLSHSRIVLKDFETTKLEKNLHAQFHQGRAATSGGQNDGEREGTTHGTENVVDSLKHGRGCGDRRSPCNQEGAPYMPGCADRTILDNKQDDPRMIKHSHEIQDHANIIPYSAYYHIGVSKEDQLDNGKQDHDTISKPFSPYTIIGDSNDYNDQVVIKHGLQKQNPPSAFSEHFNPNDIEAANEPEPPGYGY